MYQPMAYVKLHRHKVQEQVYHVIEGEGLMEIDGEKRVVRSTTSSSCRPVSIFHREHRDR